MLLASADEPTTYIGLAAVVVVTVGGWVKAWIDGRAHGHQAIKTRSDVGAMREELGEVREQVKNSHETNLRDDLDSLRVEMRAGFDEMRTAHKETRRDIGGIREELRDERRERIEGDRRADERRRRHGDPM
nr:DUF2746 domain-containing protein [Mycobacterium eburneum]